jgi:hypothetical protein
VGRLPTHRKGVATPPTSWGHLPQIFKDRRRRSRRLEGRGALPAVRPYLRASRFQGRRCLRATTPTPPEGEMKMIGGLSKRGENPPWGLRRCLWARLRHRGAAPGEPGARTLPHPGPGISTWFPFAGGRDALQPPTPCGVGTERRASVPCQLQEACLSCPKPTPPSDRIRREPPRHRTTELPRPPAAQSRTLGTASPDRLGPTNPCPTAVRMEPFPTSALKVPA